MYAWQAVTAPNSFYMQCYYHCHYDVDTNKNYENKTFQYFRQQLESQILETWDANY